MTKRDAEEQQKFIALLYEEFPTKEGIMPFATELMRLARRSASYCEAVCSYELTPLQEARGEGTARRLVELCQEFGVHVILQGDPRGYTVKLLLPSGRYNTWGGAEGGWGVPGS